MSEFDDLLHDDVLVGPEWIRSSDGRTFDVADVATGEVLATVPDLTNDDVAAAVSAASSALAGWRDTLADERADHLRRWAGELRARAEPAAALIVAEQGKPLAEARQEVKQSIDYLEWFAEEARRVAGFQPAPNARDRDVRVLQVPVGVVAAITPWNFPMGMIARKAGAAIAAGCTVVVKPAESTPLSALALADLAERSGLPAGVLNVVTGDPERVGKVLLDDSVVRKLTFTGSTRTGKHLAGRAAATLKRVSLELGGNNPLLVFADADLDLAVDAIIRTKFRNAGQVCVTLNRVLAESSVVDALVERLVRRVERLQVGPGTDPATDVGPLIDPAAVARVSELVDDAVRGGAVVHTGGSARGERYYAPTVLTSVGQDAAVCAEEVFGPVITVQPFNSEDEAIGLANDTPYGLAAYAFTRDRGRLHRLAHRLEVGMLGLNDGSVAGAAYPFGGTKESGYGREGSVLALEEFLEPRLVCESGVLA